MAGIIGDSVADFQNRVTTFSDDYIADWRSWLATPAPNRPDHLAGTLRKWQACRPNRMRRTRKVGGHPAPYIEDLVTAAAPNIAVLGTFNIALSPPLASPAHIAALTELWIIFENLSYAGRSRFGRSGVVGISKAVLLLTDGRVGPAFDRKVRENVGIRSIGTPDDWIRALGVVNNDIRGFELHNGVSFSAATPVAYAHLHPGRIYDMALGPR